MTIDHATTIVHAVDKLNAGDVDGYIAGLYTPGCRFHGFPDAFTPDRDGIAEFFRTLIAAVPDTRITAQDLLVDGDRVAIRFTLTGTHRGELFGVAGTGRSLDVEGITVLHFVDGLVTERWNRLDDVALLTQLGALPAAASA
ncbi:MAG TPA: ester cyclase [Jatrophihabitantaceae bacterium]|jgi:predicted ester cyclase